jgi:hypothetical protein
LERQVANKRAGGRELVQVGAAVAALAVARMVEDASPQARDRQYRQRLARIREVVACPKLHASAAESLAAATVYGIDGRFVQWAEVEESLRRLVRLRAAGQLNSPASCYFNGARRNLFAQAGIRLRSGGTHG